MPNELIPYKYQIFFPPTFAFYVVTAVQALSRSVCDVFLRFYLIWRMNQSVWYAVAFNKIKFTKVLQIHIFVNDGL